jgi:hypothetical protein
VTASFTISTAVVLADTSAGIYAYCAAGAGASATLAITR